MKDLHEGKKSNNWTLTEAKIVVNEIKEAAISNYGHELKKDDIEEVIMLIDSNSNYSSIWDAINTAVNTYFEELKQAASRALYISLVHDDMEETNNNKKEDKKAI